MLVTSIFSFSHNVFYPSQKRFQFFVTFILSSTNAFNLDKSKVLSFGKGLNSRQNNQNRITNLVQPNLKLANFNEFVKSKAVLLTPKGSFMTIVIFAAIVEQDQAAKKIFPNIRSSTIYHERFI